MQQTFLKLKAAGSDMTFTGWASTNDRDRQGDIVEPAGAEYELPVPLLWQHDHKQPVGAIQQAHISPTGIRVTGKLTDGVPRASEAWALMQDGALALSVGFQALESQPLPGGGLRFTKWSWHELSLVSVPANPQARLSIGKGMVVLGQAAPKAVTRQPSEFEKALAQVPFEYRGSISEQKSMRDPATGQWSLLDADGYLRWTTAAVDPDAPAPAAPPAPAARKHAPTASADVFTEAMLVQFGEAIGQAINDAVRPLHERIKALEASGTQKGMTYAGDWQEPLSYAPGAVVRHAGALHVLTRDAKPGHAPRAGSAWQRLT